MYGSSSPIISRPGHNLSASAEKSSQRLCVAQVGTGISSMPYKVGAMARLPPLLEDLNVFGSNYGGLPSHCFSTRQSGR
jgi:hypothetical protein